MRETIREMDKVAIRRMVLTNREHIIALEARDKGLIGTLPRYPTRSGASRSISTRSRKVTKDMLDLAKHIVNQKAGRFDPEKFEDHYESALVELINQKRAGKVIRPKERPRGENVVDLMDALRKSVGGAAAEAAAQKEAHEEVEEGVRQSEGNGAAVRGQETGEGGGCEEAGIGGSAEVGVK
ncbi:DNA end-binding protein Ku [Bradyrhizobium sp. Rc3b]|nr:DNA end-binding protein Ku [Bradyrhizobium sp. Rc3b]